MDDATESSFIQAPGSTVAVFWSFDSSRTSSIPLPVVLEQLQILAHRYQSSTSLIDGPLSRCSLLTYASLAERPLEQQREIRARLSEIGATLTNTESDDPSGLERMIIVDALSTALDTALRQTNNVFHPPPTLKHLTIIFSVADPAPLAYAISALRNRNARVVLIVSDTQEKRFRRGKADELWTWDEVLALEAEEDTGKEPDLMTNGAQSDIKHANTPGSDSDCGSTIPKLSLSARMTLGKESSGGTTLGATDFDGIWGRADGSSAAPSSDSKSDAGEIIKEEIRARDARQALFVDTTSKQREDAQTRLADFGPSSRSDSAKTPSPPSSTSAEPSPSTSLSSHEVDPSIIRWSSAEQWNVSPSVDTQAAPVAAPLNDRLQPPPDAPLDHPQIDGEDAQTTAHVKTRSSLELPSPPAWEETAHDSQAETKSTLGLDDLAARFGHARFSDPAPRMSSSSSHIPPPLNTGWAERAAAKARRQSTSSTNTAFTRGAYIAPPLPTAPSPKPTTSDILRQPLYSNSGQRLHPPLAPLVVAFRALQRSRESGMGEDGRVTRGALGRKILDSDPNLYKKLEKEEHGLWCFMELVNAAEQHGVVECGFGKTRKLDWVRLTKDWR